MRKLPKQARAGVTVNAIKQAALKLLATEGFSACGTDRIAQKAGVSIGSLYKYFPNREAVLKALYEDASLEYARVVGELTLRILALPTYEGMELTMRSVMSMHERSHLVLLQLATEVPELHLESQPMAFRNLVRANIRAYLQHRNPGLRAAEVALRCFFIEKTVFGCIQGYMSDLPAAVSNRNFCHFMAQLVADIVDRPARAVSMKTARRRRNLQ